MPWNSSQLKEQEKQEISKVARCTTFIWKFNPCKTHWAFAQRLQSEIRKPHSIDSSLTLLQPGSPEPGSGYMKKR